MYFSFADLCLGILVFYPMAGALAAYLIGRKNKAARDYFADFVVISEFISALWLFINYCPPPDSIPIAPGDITINYPLFGIDGFAGLGIHFMADEFRCVYALVASIMWMMTTVFSREYFKHYRNRNRYYMFMLITLGATMGVFLSADLYTTFIFFEIMSFTSYVWVAHDEKKASLKAAETYLAVAIIGGMAMLMGLFMLYNALGSLEISRLHELASACSDKTMLYIAGSLITVGFGAKAGSFPLHIWLPKAHPVAPAPASALLSGILTKSGIFGLIAVSCNLFLHDGSWGSVILLLGTVTMFGGALLALFSVDLKRTLACSSMSQIGFIMVGIGMQGLLGEENAIAAQGTLFHMINHSLIKLVLFMAAGVIFMNIHKLNLNDIRGFGRKKPLLNIIFLTGALGIGGIPLFNGYVSKTFLHEGIVEYTHILQEGAPVIFLGAGEMKIIEWIFLISGGITIAYMTKLYIAIFIEKNKDAALQEKYDGMKKYMNPASSAVLAISAVLLLYIGIGAPLYMSHGIGEVMFSLFMGVKIMHPGELEFINLFSPENLKGGMISILIGAGIYLLIVRPLLMAKSEKSPVREYADRWPSFIDMEDYFYRPFIKGICYIGGFFCRILDNITDTTVVVLRKTIYCDLGLPFELREGTQLTYRLGKILNYFQMRREKRHPERKTIHRDYVHRLALLHMNLKENRSIIVRSLSFGLTFTCIGLILTIAYLLIINHL